MDDMNAILKGDTIEPKEPMAPEIKEEPTGEPEPKAEAPKAPDKGEPPAPTNEPTVPRAALEDERRKRQEYERRLRELEEQKAKAPDPVADPEGFRQHFEVQSQKALLNERLNMSEQLVRQTMGDDAVETAVSAFEDAIKANPGLYQTVMVSKHPYQTLLDWHRREQVLATVGTDLSAYEKRLREQIMEELKAAPAALGVPPVKSAPSLANRPSAGSRGDPYTGPTPLRDLLKS
jgi:hypothetical protein